MKVRNCSFCFDNWTKLGALYYVEVNNLSKEEVEVKEFVSVGQWNRQKLPSVLSNEDIINHVCHDIKPPYTNEGCDTAWWMGNPNGSFSLKSAWEM